MPILLNPTSPTPYDVLVTGNGQTVLLFTPISPEAQDWFGEHVRREPWANFGPAVAVDHRFSEPLLEALNREGFTIRVQ